MATVTVRLVVDPNEQLDRRGRCVSNAGYNFFQVFGGSFETFEISAEAIVKK